MKTPENQRSKTQSSSLQNPFFKATPDRAVFSADQATSLPFFQPKTEAQEAENLNPSLIQRMPAFESEIAAPVQAKLTIGQPGDLYEQEADRVASQVVRQIDTPNQSAQGQAVQRQEEQKEELQAKPEINALQRQEEKQEELQTKPELSMLQRQEEPKEELQMKPTLQGRNEIEGGEASSDLSSTIDRARGTGQPLDTSLQRSMGQAMGVDFSGVRVHTDTQADQLNRSLQAKAFTTGKDVFFRQGEYSPESRGGQELIAHELTHVVQQSGGQG